MDLPLTAGALDRVTSGHGPAAACCASILEAIGSGHDPRWARAAAMTAVATDAWGGFAYHSAEHHADVAGALSRLLDFAPSLTDMAWMGLAAAFGHDLGYDPSPSMAEPFMREAQTCRLLAPIWARAGLHPREVSQGCALVLATAPAARPWLRAALHQMTPPPAPPGLAWLTPDSRLLHLAALLSDADLAPSAGHSLERARRQSALLASETGVDGGDAAILCFFDRIVGPAFLTGAASMFHGRALATIRRGLQPREQAPAGLRR